jgi:hypothetical protein
MLPAAATALSECSRQSPVPWPPSAPLASTVTAAGEEQEGLNHCAPRTTGREELKFLPMRYEQSRPNRRTTNTLVLRQVKMESSITEELKKYTNSSFMVLYRSLQSFSNAIGLIQH